MTSALHDLASQLEARAALPDRETRRAIRESAGVSQIALGRAVGVSGFTIHCWEVGRAAPRPRHVLPYLAGLRMCAAATAEGRDIAATLPGFVEVES